VATTVTQTVRLGRLVDTTTSLLRHRDERPAVPPSQGGIQGGSTPYEGGIKGGSTPSQVGNEGGPEAAKPIGPLPPHFADVIRAVYGLNFNPQREVAGATETEQTQVSAQPRL